MDTETSNAIERLTDRVDGLERSLRADLADLRAEVRDGLAEVRTDLRAEFRDGLAENRRHAQVLFESLRDDIRIVAEGLAALTVKIDRKSW